MSTLADEGCGCAVWATISMMANATPMMHRNPMKNRVKVLVKYRGGFIPLLYRRCESNYMGCAGDEVASDVWLGTVSDSVMN